MSASIISAVVFEEIPTGGGQRIGVARLNAEKSLNSLSLEMINLLSERLPAWASDPTIALVMLEGAGERAFCAGADLLKLHAACVAITLHHNTKTSRRTPTRWTFSRGNTASTISSIPIRNRCCAGAMVW